MRTQETVEVELYRHADDDEDGPAYETYDVPAENRMTVLGALEYIGNELGVGVSYRSYCHSNKCGLCGVRVNGVPVLACREPAMPKMRIEPMDNFPVIKDLVVDRTELDEGFERLNPRMVRDGDYEGFPEPLSHESMDSAFKLGDCIECGLCTSACPVVSNMGIDEFAGPAAYVKAGMRELDPRDQGDRTQEIVDNGLFKCVSCFRCVEVCPKDIDIVGESLEPLKRQALEDGAYAGSDTFDAFEACVEEKGDVNPAELMRKAKGLGMLREYRTGLGMLKRGRLSVRQPKNPGIDEIRTTMRRARGDD